MANQAYERNFQGLANACQNNSSESSEIRKVMAIQDKQLQDLIMRCQRLESQVQTLLARTMPSGSAKD